MLSEVLIQSAVALSVTSIAFWKLPTRFGTALSVFAVAHLCTQAMNAPKEDDWFQPTWTGVMKEATMAGLVISLAYFFTSSVIPGIYTFFAITSRIYLTQVSVSLLWRLFPAVAVASLAANRTWTAGRTDRRVKAVQDLLASNMVLLRALKGDKLEFHDKPEIEEATEESWSFASLLPLGLLALNLFKG